MLNVTLNSEKNGIEIRFDARPDSEILDELKANGFRWSRKQKMWYAKQNDDRMMLVNSISEGKNFTSGDVKVKPKKEEYKLWDLTRTENIPHHYEEERLHDTKEIAKRVRTHLRKRFPMCKWSVTSDYNSIDVRMKSAPWDSDSEVLKAIAEYAYRYTDSYNYNHSDIMTDYFDVNFYGSYHPYNITDSYYFEQREETVSEMRIRQDFEEAMEDWRLAEELREQAEAEERIKRMEQERIEREEYEKIRQENHEKIEQNAKVYNADYFILNLKERGRKEDHVEGYMKDYDCEPGDEDCNLWKRMDAKVARNVYMDAETYDLFSHSLLDDYSFLEKMGGSMTEDNRIESMTDYYQMSKEERETVEWYSYKCVAILVGDKLMMVIDPQGYDYARYCFFPDEETEVDGNYTYEQVLSDEELAKNKELAEVIEDTSAEIIMTAGIAEDWETESFPMYKDMMKEWIYSHEFPFHVGVVRAIQIESLKVAMYKLLTEVDGIQEQFKRSGLEEGEKITIVRIGEFGGLNSVKGIYKEFSCEKYAQYDNAVKLIYRPKNKRQDYWMWLYKDVIIYRGWLDIPEDLFWEVIREDEESIMRKSIFMSFDSKQYDVVLDYFTERDILPVVNTHKPIF